MTKYQKVAALVLRLAALAIVIYSIFAAIMSISMMPAMLWILLPMLIGGVILFKAAIPLAKIVASGIDD